MWLHMYMHVCVCVCVCLDVIISISSCTHLFVSLLRNAHACMYFMCVCVCTLCACVCVNGGDFHLVTQQSSTYLSSGSCPWFWSVALHPSSCLPPPTHTDAHSHTHTLPNHSHPASSPPLSTLLIDIHMLSIWLTKGCMYACVCVHVCASVYCDWWRVFFRAVRGRDWAILRGPWNREDAG